MKIFIDNIIFSLQKVGGISLVWKEILMRLSENVSHQVYILEYENARENFFRKQLEFKENLVIPQNSIFLFFKRYMDVRFSTNEKGIFHSTYYRLARGKNIINVTTVHDFTYEYFFNGLVKRLHSWQKKRAILRSDGIICISESTKRDLLHFFPQFPKEKIRVIYNGADERFKRVDLQIPFSKQHLFEDFGYVIYVGDHKTKYKNFEIAVHACQLKKMKLLIIGGGPLSQKDKKKLDNSLGATNYKLLLNVSVEDLNQYYNRAYCLLYPSLYEGFGIPVVEAQRAGCPVIATYSSSIPEVIADVFFAVKDPTPENIAEKMQYLKLNSSRRSQTIEAGLEKALFFDWEKTYQQTVEFYKELYKSENINYNSRLQ